MADGKRRDEWDRTSAVLAMLVNVNMDTRKHKPISPSEFNPFAPRRREGRIEVEMKDLRHIFVDQMGFKVRKQGARDVTDSE